MIKVLYNNQSLYSVILKEQNGNELTHSSLKILAFEASVIDTVVEIYLFSQQAIMY